MKKPLVIWPFISLLAFMLVSFGFGIPLSRQKAIPAVNSGFAVVELFTSEGCSSCPPADELAAALASDYPDAVFVLGFHVDYWNYLGWKDPFSKAAWTERQQAYARAFAPGSIYTPQVVVNGRFQFTGSDSVRLYNTVNQELAKIPPAGIVLSAEANGQTIRVNYTAAGAEKSLVHFALVQQQASSVVQRGENKGRQLKHIDVVRDFISSAKASGFVDLHLPDGAYPPGFRVIGFVQQRKDLQIGAARACSIR